MQQMEHGDTPGEMKLRDKKNGLYQIHSKHGAFEGPLNLIYWQAVEWGLTTSELDFGIKVMKRENHDYATFGIFGGFIFSANDERKAS